MKNMTHFKNIACLILFFGIQFIATSDSLATSLTDSNGVWTISTQGSTISIKFKPDSLKVNCPKIGYIQTVKITFKKSNGDSAVVVNPGSIAKAFSQMGDDLSGGSVVDHLWCEKDPFYNGDDSPQDTTWHQGSSSGNGTATTPSEMDDTPNIPDDIFPQGMGKVVMEFETCAICMSGPNSGTSYGCIKWKYERDIEGTGVVTLVSTGIEARSPAHTAATTTFNTNHTSGTTAVCPEDLALSNKHGKTNHYKGAMYTRSNNTYEVLGVDGGVSKGISMPGMTLPMIPLHDGDVVFPGEFVFVPSGRQLSLRRNDFLPVPDPTIPFQASFFDVFYGSQEMVETGLLNGLEHTGLRVKNCSDMTLCAMSPVNSPNPNGHVLYSARIDNQTQSVVLSNNALSTHQVQCINLMMGSGIINLNPGDSVVFNYPGQLPACASTLNLRLFIQGYMTSPDGMNTVLQNQLEPTYAGQCDSVDVILHQTLPPYLPLAQQRTVLHTDGRLVCNFPQLPMPFYVAVKHRNLIETWSATPIEFINGVASYDFTNAPFKAFGNNQVQVYPGVWAMYNGDVNQDLSIDLLDNSLLDSLIELYAFGYFAEDLNGDGNIDLLDTVILEENINQFVYSIQPN